MPRPSASASSWTATSRGCRRVEGYLRSGKTWMVVAGAAHMTGSDGLPAMLRARGYQVEQL